MEMVAPSLYLFYLPRYHQGNLTLHHIEEKIFSNKELFYKTVFYLASTKFPFSSIYYILNFQYKPNTMNLQFSMFCKRKVAYRKPHNIIDI